jgi:hypothetical protein
MARAFPARPECGSVPEMPALDFVLGPPGSPRSGQDSFGIESRQGKTFKF